MLKTKKIIHNHDEFETNVEKILQYANEISADLPYKTKMSIEEKCMLLESLTLRACALWEKFLENELIFAVNLNPSKLIKEMQLKSSIKLDNNLIRGLLFSDIFRDFHDLDRSKSFFSKYIVDDYNPCGKISNTQVKNIQAIYALRNYLSHYSDFAKRKLFITYKKRYKMTKFIEPGKFLIKSKGKIFQDLISNFKFASINMKTIYK